MNVLTISWEIENSFKKENIGIAQANIIGS